MNFIKVIFTVLLFICAAGLRLVYAQQPITTSEEEQLEMIAEAEQAEPEDDSWLTALERFRKNPVNLNFAGEEELRELRLLSDAQIENLLSYRKLLGKLINIYELQAVPGWDIAIINRLLPFIMVGDAVSISDDLGRRFLKGNHSLLLRYSQVLERSVGYYPRTNANYYLGSPQHFFVRYRYQYKNLLQYGLVADKDAGEQFFKGQEKNGFDFYSFHLFFRKKGIVQALALGDFTVNLGQGLICYQSLAFGRGSDVAAVRLQSPVLKPYNSPGEFNFHRGIGLTLRKGALEGTVFASWRKLSVNTGIDSGNAADLFTSFLASGYHRTAGELEDRNNMLQTTIGGNLAWNKNNFHIGVNALAYHFSLALQKRDEPYNLYAVSGQNWSNLSIDYHYTYRNFHFFGEAASDKNNSVAVTNGVVISVSPQIDFSFLYRSFDKAYQAIDARAFAKSSSPGNENGFYAGIVLRPSSVIRLLLFADSYRFPWLKYGVDAPSSGKEFSMQIIYTPDKKTEIVSRYRVGTNESNEVGNNGVINKLARIPVKQWRTQINLQVGRGLEIRNRFEVSGYGRDTAEETGFLGYSDVTWKPPLRGWSVGCRLQYFETGGYESRLYAFENDVLYYYSVPAFFDRGLRYYCCFQYHLNKQILGGLKWSQTIYSGKSASGSALDEIKGKSKSDLHIQFVIYL